MIHKVFYSQSGTLQADEFEGRAAELQDFFDCPWQKVISDNNQVIEAPDRLQYKPRRVFVYRKNPKGYFQQGAFHREKQGYDTLRSRIADSIVATYRNTTIFCVRFEY